MDATAADNSSVLISVIVPCFNEAARIAGFLRELLRQELPRGATWEAAIADGMSDDGTREVLREFCAGDQRLRTVDNPRRFVSAGLNAAIAETHGEVIVRMDVHTAYAPDYLAQCLRALKETAADAVGGPWVAVGSDYISRAVALALNSPLAIGGGKAHDARYSGPVGTVYLGCWNRRVFEKYGLFDVGQIRNQDEELNARIRLGGGLVWQAASIRSWYTPRSSLAALFRQYVQYGYWKVRSMKKHRRVLALRHLVPGGLVLSLSLALAAALFAAWGRIALAALAGIYLLYNVATTAVICSAPGGGRYLPVVPAALAVMQLGYGYGSLRGVFDFVIAGRRMASAHTACTR